MEPTKDPISFRFFTEIGIIEQLARNRLERGLPDGLKISQFSVLNHLVRLGGEWSPARLARAFQVTKGAMTNTLQRLEKRANRFRRLVERRPGAVPRLVADFRAVDESFRVAEARVRCMGSWHLRYESRQVGALVEELDRELQRKVRFARRGSPGHVGNHSRYSGYREFAWRW